jgi:hypothetical protein
MQAAELVQGDRKVALPSRIARIPGSEATAHCDGLHNEPLCFGKIFFGKILIVDQGVADPEIGDCKIA